MEIKWFKSRDMALDEILGEEKDLAIVRHVLIPGYIIKTHYHPKADEWVIISHGNADIAMKEDGEIRQQHIVASQEVAAIHIPKGTKHSLQNGNIEIAYVVLKSQIDETVYCEW